MVVFTEENYGGTPKYLKPGESVKFAYNEGNNRRMEYKSMLVYFNRTVVWERQDGSTASYWTPGKDILDIPEFLKVNTVFSDPIWYNYDVSAQFQFLVKVV